MNGETRMNIGLGEYLPLTFHSLSAATAFVSHYCVGERGDYDYPLTKRGLFQVRRLRLSGDGVRPWYTDPNHFGAVLGLPYDPREGPEAWNWKLEGAEDGGERADHDLMALRTAFDEAGLAHLSIRRHKGSSPSVPMPPDMTYVGKFIIAGDVKPDDVRVSVKDAIHDAGYVAYHQEDDSLDGVTHWIGKMGSNAKRNSSRNYLVTASQGSRIWVEVEVTADNAHEAKAAVESMMEKPELRVWREA